MAKGMPGVWRTGMLCTGGRIRPRRVGIKAEPALSLQVLEELGVGSDESVIDVGAGASGMAVALLGRGFRDVAALDVSAAALQEARNRLGVRADQVRWIEGGSAWLGA